MNKTFLGIMIIVLCMGAACLYYFGSRDSKRGLLAPHPLARPFPDSVLPKARDLMNRSIALKGEIGASKVPQACRESWKETLSKSYREISRNFENLRNALGNPTCLSQSGYPDLSRLNEDCAEIFLDHNNLEAKEKIQQKCVQHLAQYRAYVIHQSTKDTTDFASLSTEVLLNKLAAMISSQEMDLAQIAAIGEVLSQKEPHTLKMQFGFTDN